MRVFVIKRFRYQKWRYQKPSFAADMAVRFPLHKPYILLMVQIENNHLGWC